MIRHIVLFNVKEGVDVAETVKIAESVLVPLVGKIEGLNFVEVKQNFAGTDFALYCELESREAMAAGGMERPFCPALQTAQPVEAASRS